jgi:Cu+-exporting ATPase
MHLVAVDLIRPVETAHDRHPGADTSVADPVCGMRVDPATAAATLARDGTRYHFCSTHCADRFATEPTDLAPKSA